MGAFNGENDDGECVPLPVFIGEWGWELNVKGKEVSYIESCRRRPTESVPWQTHVLHNHLVRQTEGT